MMFFDSRGLICQSDGDPGDQLHREGWFAVPFFLGYEQAVKIGADRGIRKVPADYFQDYSYQRAMQALTEGGPLRRSWYGPGPEWTDPKDVSRDQIVPNVTAAFLASSPIVHQWKKDFWWFCPNWDLSFPMFRNHLRRATGETPESLGDTQLYLTSQFVSWKIRRNPDDVDNALNHLQLLILSELSRPTEGSRKSIKYFFDNCDVMRALRHYHRPASGGNWEMAEIYEELCDDLKNLRLRSKTERIIP